MLDEQENCLFALPHACASDCESSAGHCSFADDDNAYHCECSAGITATVRAPTCEGALTRCEPACQSDRGACYGDIFGWSFECQCRGTTEWHGTSRGLNSCTGQLADACGAPRP
jgi:hypothetical protein